MNPFVGSPVQKEIIITQGYKKDIHRGIDIGIPEFSAIIAPERCSIRTFSLIDGVDKYGNHYLTVNGLYSGFILKFIHTKPQGGFTRNEEIDKGIIIGHTDAAYAGNSRGGHLHFEVWRDKLTPIDPVIDYFDVYGVPYIWKK